jgi:hypothetical protein
MILKINNNEKEIREKGKLLKINIGNTLCHSLWAKRVGNLYVNVVQLEIVRFQSEVYKTHE